MSAVLDVGDAIELTLSTKPGATVVVDWLNPDQVPIEQAVTVAENPSGSGKFPHTFVVSSPGVWTAEFRASGNTAAVERYYVRATALAGPAPFAAVGDVAAQYGSMTKAEESLAGWLLRAASNMVRARQPLVDQQIAAGQLSGDLVALAVTNMVLRVLRNPAGLRSETVGPFSRSYDTGAAAGLLVFTEDELALIAPTGATVRTAAIGEMRPRPALAIVPGRPRGWWGPDGWWQPVVGGEDIVVVRPAPRDKYGDPVPGGTTTETPSSGWLFAPGASSELHNGQNSVDTDAELYRTGAPGEEDIRPADQIRVRDVLYEVVGEPAVWRLGTVIRLRKFTG